MQIQIVNGIYTDGNLDIRKAFPVNLRPVHQQSGVSNGYLRPASGILLGGTGPGIDRGGIEWNGVCYRVMGTKLVSIAEDWTITTLGDVGGSGQVSMDYSFDRLAIASSNVLYYWDGSTLTQVTDPDLGIAKDMQWIDGYFMTTDGENLVVTELQDPTAVDPLKYGSAEIDPDAIQGVDKIRNEALAVGRYTIERYSNEGGNLFPFQRIEGAQITKGAVGTHAFVVIEDSICFVGSGRNEAIGVYVGADGGHRKISDREVDLILKGLTESQLSQVICEKRIEDSHVDLIIHLPDRTLVYDFQASSQMQTPVWHVLSSGLGGLSQYKARNAVRCYGRSIVGDPTSSNVGYYVENKGDHWGTDVSWEFTTPIVYNEGRGAIFHELELVCATGSALGSDHRIFTQYSKDGILWSDPKFTRVGGPGDYGKRIHWLSQGMLRNMRMQRFGGTTAARASFARLEARLEPLAY